MQDNLIRRIMASTYLSRTPASSGNLKTWTFSAWFKKGSGGYLFGAGDILRWRLIISSY
jgi:hypothetical protein